MCRIKLTDRVETGVGTETAEHAGVVVAYGSVVELLCPVGCVVHFGKEYEHCALELAHLLWFCVCSAHHFCEYGSHFRFGVILGIEFLKSVVGELASSSCKEVVTLLQCVLQVGKCLDIDAACLAQAVDVCTVVHWIFDGHCLVGTPCRQHHGVVLAAFGCIFGVEVEVVDRVVGGAHQFYVVSAHKSAGRVVGVVLQEVGAVVVNLACRFGFQHLVDSECGLQFEVAPVVERIAHAVRHGSGPGLKLLVVRCVGTSAVTFSNAVSAHCTPFVVVATQPHLGEGTESIVVGHHLRTEVAVIVYDRQRCCMVVIQMLSQWAVQQEVGIDERFHNFMVVLLVSTIAPQS